MALAIGATAIPGSKQALRPPCEGSATVQAENTLLTPKTCGLHLELMP
jgi:hypothetical protein